MNSSQTGTIPPIEPDIGVLSLDLDSFEPQSMEEALSHTTVEHLQLARGRFLGQLMHAEFTASSLDWGSYNLPLLATGGMPAHRVTLGFILAADGESMMNGKTFQPPALVLFSEETELYYRLAPGTQWLAFQVERSLLERLGLSLQPGSAGPAGNSTTGIRQLNQNLQDTLAVLRNISVSGHDPEIPDPLGCIKEAEARLFDLLASAVASMQPDPADSRLDRSETIRLVRFATDYILAHHKESMRIGTICCELDCDLKTLERAFHKVHGMSPRQFLTLTRLNNARQLLLNGKGKHSVTHTAMASGIQHLGRFSQQYRLWFGERPSKTLARSMHSGSKA